MITLVTDSDTAETKFLVRHKKYDTDDVDDNDYIYCSHII